MLRFAIRKLHKLAVAMVVKQPSDLPNPACFIEMVDTSLFGDSNSLKMQRVDLMNDEVRCRQVKKLDRNDVFLPIDLLPNP